MCPQSGCHLYINDRAGFRQPQSLAACHVLPGRDSFQGDMLLYRHVLEKPEDPRKSIGSGRPFTQITHVPSNIHEPLGAIL